jgi:hypothetical protein
MDNSEKGMNVYVLYVLCRNLGELVYPVQAFLFLHLTCLSSETSAQEDKRNRGYESDLTVSGGSR